MERPNKDNYPMFGSGTAVYAYRRDAEKYIDELESQLKKEREQKDNITNLLQTLLIKYDFANMESKTFGYNEFEYIRKILNDTKTKI